MAKQFAIKDRDGTIHPQDSLKDARQSQQAYGGMLVSAKDGAEWKPHKRKRIFLWFFLAVQAIFIIWIIAGSNSHQTVTVDSPDVIHQCANNAWQALYKSYQECLTSTAHDLDAAGQAGTGIGVALIVIIWVIVDILLAIIYGIYRLARR